MGVLSQQLKNVQKNVKTTHLGSYFLLRLSALYVSLVI